MPTDLSQQLATTLAHLEAGRDVEALEAMLDAWRACRNPRLADLVDRIGERASAARPTVSGKSVKERTERWLALAAKKESADLGALLATPWPGTWKAAVPVLEALKPFDDPRVAMALCRLVEATPYDTYTSHQFYGPLLTKVRTLGDLRVLPLLETDLARVKSTYWRQGTRVTMERVVSELRKVKVPPLGKAEEDAVAALEAVFAARVSAAKASRKSESELLADIYEDPADDARRAVYADWASEQGDPRGEFISLQLARERGTPSPEALKRERALLNKHGKAWLGQLDRVLEKEGRVFRRGFLAQAVVAVESRGEKVGPEFEDPAWATVETLGLSWRAAYYFGEQIVGLPWFRRVRRLRAFPEKLAVFAAKAGSPPNLVELDLQIDEQLDEAARSELWSGDAFPALESLALEGQLPSVAARLDSPLARKVRRLTYVNTDCPLGEVLRLVEQKGLTLVQEAAVVTAYRDRQSAWVLTLKRGPNDAFNQLSCEPDPTARGFLSAQDLSNALASLPEGLVAELSVSRAFPCDFGQDALARIGAALRRFPKARLDVSWEQLPDGQESGAVPVRLYCGFKDPAGPEAKALLEHVRLPPLSLKLDSYELNAGKLLPLGDGDPYEFVAQAFTKKRTNSVALVQKSSARKRISLERYSRSLEVPLAPRARAAFLDWVVGVVKATRANVWAPLLVRYEGGGWGERHDLPGLAPFGVAARWLIAPDDLLDEWIPFDELQAAAGKEQLEWLDVRRVGRSLLLVLGASPVDGPTAAQVQALRGWGSARLWKSWEQRAGFVPHQRVLEEFAPLLNEHGFSLVEPFVDDDHLVRTFARRDPQGTRALRLQFNELVSRDLHFTVSGHHYLGRPDVDFERMTREDYGAERRDWHPEKYEVGDEARLKAALARFEEHFEKTLLPWFKIAAG
ncbi:MAG: TIGR02996 domain-containing protein [Myxococcales bacterium]